MVRVRETGPLVTDRTHVCGECYWWDKIDDMNGMCVNEKNLKRNSTPPFTSCGDTCWNWEDDR